MLELIRKTTSSLFPRELGDPMLRPEVDLEALRESEQAANEARRILAVKRAEIGPAADGKGCAAVAASFTHGLGVLPMMDDLFHVTEYDVKQLAKKVRKRDGVRTRTLTFEQGVDDLERFGRQLFAAETSSAWLFVPGHMIGIIPVRQDTLFLLSVVDTQHKPMNYLAVPEDFTAGVTERVTKYKTNSTGILFLR